MHNIKETITVSSISHVFKLLVCTCYTMDADEREIVPTYL